MAIRCPKCEKKINNNYIKDAKNMESFKCPSCKVDIEESGKSKILAIIIAIIPIMFLAFFIKNFFIRIVVIFIWAFIINSHIRPLISKYKLVKK
ncbi:hypothetical protein [uncultured Clostridium sp.]|jgi:NAD-dependent SIR2 family protein deacetylase|uniref:hypothetical protein n=1 Tax=uncultured Clostridium sp. TaxID=59620 RepID=UPI00260BDE3B|nr:hypothetical protein [uncultured Clostridium sp.]